MSLKKKVILLLSMLHSAAIFAQFDSQRTQYMFDISAYNPGAVADKNLFNVTGDYRLQWAGFSNAPNDVAVLADMPFGSGESKHGAGISFLSESIGLFQNQSFMVQYAYRLKIWNGYMGLGVSVGAISQSFEYGDVDLTGNDGNDIDGDQSHSSDDSMIPSSDQNDMSFDAAFGAYYSDEKMYVGLSFLHLNSPKFDFGEYDKVKMQPIMYLIGGYDFEMSNTDYHFKPSVLLATNFSSSQADLDCLLEYKKKIQGGLAYRFGDSFGFLFGVENIIEGLFLGYSYDLPVSGMIKSGGSHEICLKYSFKLDFSRKDGYKSERIL